MPFSVYPKGTLAQSGTIESVALGKTVFTSNETIPLKAIFKNTGQVPLNGVLMVDLYKEGTYIDVVRGDELTVGIGEESEFTALLQPKGSGEFTLNSYVKYGSRKSNTFVVDFTVETTLFATILNSLLGVFLLAGICVGFAALVRVVHKRGLSVKDLLAQSVSGMKKWIQGHLIKKTIKKIPTTFSSKKTIVRPTVTQDVDEPPAEDETTRRW